VGTQREKTTQTRSAARLSLKDCFRETGYDETTEPLVELNEKKPRRKIPREICLRAVLGVSRRSSPSVKRKEDEKKHWNFGLSNRGGFSKKSTKKKLTHAL